MEFEGAVCVVTGAASGIGLASAKAFVEAGATVVGSDIARERLDAAAAEVGFTPVVADVGSEEGNRGLVDEVWDGVGPIDLFYANAGVALGLGDEATAADWDISWRVNAMSRVWAAAALVPRWRERGSGYFASTASAAGLLMDPRSAPYTLSKHADVAHAEWLAVNHGDVVGVSVVCPEWVQTPLFQGFDDAVDGTADLSGDGVLQPEDIAAAVVSAVREGTFLVTPHEQVRGYEAGKVKDRDWWLAAMRRSVSPR